MKIAYFDPFSGASGDMMLGALVDAGLTVADLSTQLSKLDLGGYQIRATQTGQHGIHGTKVTVEVHDDVSHRHWSDIRELISRSGLDEPVKQASLKVFERLAIAEAKIHNSDLDHVHFHEVGGIDAIVDICGSCIGLALLGIEDIFSGPPQVGSGFAQSMHGTIPIPAPATLELLANAGAPIAKPIPAMIETPAELLTPTGAALLTTLARFGRPSFSPTTIGYGFGSKELPWPNALRVWIGELDDDTGAQGEILLETNIDDMNPQFFDLVTERLFAAGALDAWLTPVVMKKGRPGTVISTIAPLTRRSAIESVLIENTSTLGVRATAIERVKTARRIEQMTTRWGDVPVKVRQWNGRVIDVMPEYENCAAIAREHDVPVREVWNEAHRLAEALVGQRVS
jgi:pyridinium-3,5-bisthiocarboxylic acid mononucleotide nickel chelatase